jgi:hypothetical protein
MRQKLDQYFTRLLWIFSLTLLLVLFFQNCAIYKSEDKTSFETLLASNGNSSTCLPYIDAALASQYTGSVRGGVYVQSSHSPDNSIFYCKIDAADNVAMDEVKCDSSPLDSTVATYRSAMDCANGTGSDCATNSTYQTCNSTCGGGSSCDMFSCIMGQSYQNIQVIHYYPSTVPNSFAIVYLDTSSQSYILKHFTSTVVGASCAFTLPAGVSDPTTVIVYPSPLYTAVNGIKDLTQTFATKSGTQ